MRSFNYIVAAAAILFAACITLCLADPGMDTSSAAINEEFNDGDFSYKVLTEPDGDVHGTVSVGANADIAAFVIPGTVEHDEKIYDVVTIKSSGFYALSCSSVTIPNTVTTIDVSAFDNCTDLTAVTFGNSVTTIGAYAFSYCDLSEIILPDSVTTIGQYAFQHCSSATELYIGPNVTSIGTSAFNNLFGLVDLTYDATNCSNIGMFNKLGRDSGGVRLTIGEHVTQIPARWADHSNANWVSIDIGDNVKSIGDAAFNEQSVYEVFHICLGKALTSIGQYAFYDQHIFEIENDSTLVLTKGSSDLGNVAQYANRIYKDGVSDYEYLVLDDQLWTFDMSDGIALVQTPLNPELVLPSGFSLRGTPVTEYSVLPGAISTNTRSISIPACVVTLGEIPFTTYENFQMFTVDAENPNYASVGGVLFSKDLSILYRYPSSYSQTEYTIPAGVEKIADYAFYKASRLTTIHSVDTISYIGDYAFYNSALADFEFPTSLTHIGGYAFQNTKIADVILPDNPITIGTYAFRDCAKLDNLDLGGTVSIGSFAFMSCSSLVNVEFPDSLRSIDQGAFRDTKITDITVPSGVTFGSGIFRGLMTLTNVTVSPGVKSLSIEMFKETGISSIMLPDSVTSLGDSCFRGCVNLTSFVIGDNVKSVGSYVFCDCTALAEVTVGVSLTQYNIGTGAFQGCGALNHILNKSTMVFEAGSNSHGMIAKYVNGSGVIEGTIITDVTVGDYTISYNTASREITVTGYSGSETNLVLDTIDVPEVGEMNVTAIGDRVFTGNKSLVSVSMPNVKRIGYNAFESCSSLSEVEFGPSLATIYANAFYNCTALTSVDLPDSLITIDSYAFRYAGLTSIIIPAGVQGIGVGTFTDTKLTSVVINANMCSIGNSAFSCNRTITSLTFADYSVMSMGTDSFANLAVDSLVLPEGLVEIGSSFKNGAYTSVSIPSTLNTNGGYNSFHSSKNLATITVAPGNTNYSVVDGVLYKGHTLVTYPEGLVAETFVVPAHVTSVDSYAFAYTSLRDIDFSMATGLTNVNSSAFEGCESLESVRLSGSITEIPSNAFKNCVNLVNVEMPDSIRYIRGYAFQGCLNLEEVTLPDNLYYIEYYAFTGSGIRNLVAPASLSMIGDHAFYECYNLLVVDLSQTKVEYFVSGAFTNCISLTKVCLPATFDHFNDAAFGNCISLKEIVNLSSRIDLSDEAWKEEGRINYLSLSILTDVEDSKLEVVTVDGNEYVFIHDSGYALVGYFGTVGSTFTLPVIPGIPDYDVSASAFVLYDCISEFVVAGDNSRLSVIDGVLYNADGTKLIAYPSAKDGVEYSIVVSSNISPSYGSRSVEAGYVVPAKVTSIGEFAFYGSSLAFVYVENPAAISDNTIGNYAFAFKTVQDRSSKNIYVICDVTDSEKVVGHATLSKVKYSVSGYTSTLKLGRDHVAFIYNFDNGTSVTHVVKHIGQAVEVPEPSKNYHIFSSWSDGFVSGTVAAFGDERNYTAQFTPREYMITYQNTCGVENPNRTSHNVTDEEIVLLDLERPGYTFAGWYSDEECTARVTSIPAASTQILNFFAKWTPIEYHINYHLDGGVNGDNPAVFTIESETIFLAVATKEGYSFLGWYDAGLTVKMPNIETGTIGDVDLYAKWVPVKYTVSVDLDCDVPGSVAGGWVLSDGIYTKQFDFGTTAAAIQSEFSGYTRIGYINPVWNVAGESTLGTDGMVMKLIWSPVHYSVAFVAGAADGSMVPQEFTYDVAAKLSKSAFTNGTKAFIGWATEAEGAMTYADQMEVVNLSAVDGAVINLYPVWSDRGISLSITLDGEPYLGLDVVLTNGKSEYEITDLGTGVYAVFQGIDNGIYHVMVGDLDIGEYTIQDECVNVILQYFTVTFDGNGGSAAKAQVVSEGGKAVRPAEDPVRSGYTFAGWYAGKDAYDFGTSVSGTLVLTAQWNAIEYDIEYFLDGGINVDNPVKISLDDGIVDLYDAEKEYYEFLGWYFDETYSEQVFQIDASGLQNITLYALWTPVDFTITYMNVGSAKNPNPTHYDIEKPVVFSDISLDGMVFAGWFSDSAMTVPIRGIEVGSTGNMVVYAKFEAKVFTITYLLDGKTYGTKLVRFGTIVEPVSAVKDGFDVTAWDSEDVTITDGRFTMPAHDVVLNATSSAIKYSVTYYLDGVQYGSVKAQAGNVYILTKCTKTGYDVTSWVSADVEVVDGSFVMPAKDVIFTAESTPRLIDVLVSYFANDEELMKELIVVLPYGTEYTPDVPSISGFTSPSPKTIIVGEVEHVEYEYVPMEFEVTFGAGITVMNGSSAVTSGDMVAFNTLLTISAEEQPGNVAVLYANGTAITGEFNLWATDVEFTVEYRTGSVTLTLGEGVRADCGSTVQIGTLVTLSADERRGYISVFYIDGEDLLADTFVAVSDCEITVEYELQYYSVTYMFDGANYGSISYYGYGNDVCLLEKPVKAGYTVSDWSVPVFPVTDGKFIMPAEEVVITASSTPDMYGYTINYRDSHGTLLAESLRGEAPFGSNVVSPAIQINGYSCMTGNLGLMITDNPSSNVLNYSYSVRDYSIRYHLNGGAEVANEDSYNILSSDIALNPSTRDGYTFVGWFTSEKALVRMDAIPTGTYGDLDLFAIWAKAAVVEEGSKAATAEADIGEDFVAVAIDPALDIETLDVKFNNGGSISFPMSVLTQAGTVTMKSVDKSELSEEQKEKVGNGTLFTLSTSIAENFGDDYVTVSLPYELSVGSGNRTVKVFWLQDNGELKEYECDYVNGFAVFSTNHFSNWLVIDEETSAPEPEPEPSGGKGGMCSSTIALIVISMLAVAVLPVIRFVRL